MDWNAFDTRDLLRRLMPSFGFAMDLQRLMATSATLTGHAGLSASIAKLAKARSVDTGLTGQMQRAMAQFSAFSSARAGVSKLAHDLGAGLPAQLGGPLGFAEIARSMGPGFSATERMAAMLRSIESPPAAGLSEMIRSLTKALSHGRAGRLDLHAASLAKLASVVWEPRAQGLFKLPMWATASAFAGAAGVRGLLCVDAAVLSGAAEMATSKLGDLLEAVDAALLSGTVDAPTLLDDASIIDERSWSKLPAPVRDYLRRLHLSILSIFLSILFFHTSGERGAELKAELTARLDVIEVGIADSRAGDESRLAELEKKLACDRRVIEDLLREIELKIDTSPSVSAKTQARPKFVKRSARLHAKPRTRSTVVARVVEGQEVTLFMTRGKWACVGYPDIIDGIPRVGWVRKKYLLSPR